MELIKYNAACNALAIAKNIDEVKSIHNASEAMRAYAKQAKNKQLEIDAAEIRIRAERRLGEMIREQKETIGLNQGAVKGKTGSKGVPVLDDKPTLADAGIDKKLSSRAQKIAAVPQKEFDGMMKEWRNEVSEVGERVTTNLITRGEVEKRNTELKNRKVKNPDGKYDVIVIDPPWEMEKIKRHCAPNQIGLDYPTMDIEKIKGLNIPCSDNCHLFLWTTHKYLPKSFDILNAWGFKYIFCMVWHKNGGFQPFNLPQYNCEFCLYARKGTPKFIDTKNFFTCFDAKRGAHSEKPETFYDIVKRVTSGKKIDMFNRRSIDGFDTWGNECQ